MQLPNISYYLSTGYSYLSAGYSRCSAFQKKETAFYTSIFNSALKYAGVKEPFFTPFRTRLLVYPISAAVGAIAGYFLFFKGSKPERSTPEDKATPQEPTQSPKPVNTPTKKDESPKPAPSTEENIAISDGELLPIVDFLDLIADANDLTNADAQGKLEDILLTKDLSYINGDDSAISLALMMRMPTKYMDYLPVFGVEVNELYTTGTVLSLIVRLYELDKDQLPRIQGLLNIGADPTIKNPGGESALDLAPKGGDLRKALEAAATKLNAKKK